MFMNNACGVRLLDIDLRICLVALDKGIGGSVAVCSWTGGPESVLKLWVTCGNYARKISHYACRHCLLCS